MDNNRTLDCALYYISRGWPVIPLHRIKDGCCTCGKADCSSPGKHPATPNGTKDASIDPAQIHKWFDKEGWNIGICAGEESGLVILDIDPGHGGDDSLKNLPTPPETIECLTGGGGRHLYFKHPGSDVRNSAGTLGKGLDVRGHHGYVVAPPSNHISGGEYRWKVDPKAIELADCPAWIQDRTVKRSTKSDVPGEQLNEGQRNNVLTSMAGTMRNRGLGYNAILAALQAENTDRCKPPLAQDEVEQIARSVSRYEPQKEVKWELPMPLGHFNLPVFPLEAFPRQLCVLCEFCEAVAESYQVPVDLPAMLVLSVGGASLAKRVVVHVRGDHWEPVNLFTAVVLPPANRKSAVFRAVTEPLIEFEKREVARMAPIIEQNKNQRLMLEESLKHARKQAAKAKKPEDRESYKKQASEFLEELNELENLTSPQYIGDDATPEAVARLLNDNAGRFALLSPEGDVFDLMAGRYNSGSANLGVYLKGHAGDDIRVNRANRDSVPTYVPKPALSIGIAIQPDVLRGLTLKKGFRGRGLLGRFLYSLPLSLLGRRKINPGSVEPKIVTAYQSKILDALGLEPNLDENCDPCPHIITVGSEALKEIDRFAIEIEKQLGPGGDFASMGDWAGKLVGAVCRIAGIFHGLIHAGSGNPAKTQIDAETMLGAIAIGEYLSLHAKAAFFEMGTDPDIDLARRILDWVSSEQVSEFSKTQVFNALRGSIQKANELDEPLQILVNHGYVRNVPEKRQGPGRKPSPKYEINPSWLALNTLNTYNCTADVNSTYSTYSTEKVKI